MLLYYRGHSEGGGGGGAGGKCAPSCMQYGNPQSASGFQMLDADTLGIILFYVILQEKEKKNPVRVTLLFFSM